VKFRRTALPISENLVITSQLMVREALLTKPSGAIRAADVPGLRPSSGAHGEDVAPAGVGEPLMLAVHLIPEFPPLSTIDKI